MATILIVDDVHTDRELLTRAVSTAVNVPVIASGGVFTGVDAAEKFDAGAVLVEVWTGFIYEGPMIAKRICERLR